MCAHARLHCQQCVYTRTITSVPNINNNNNNILVHLLTPDSMHARGEQSPGHERPLDFAAQLFRKFESERVARAHKPACSSCYRWTQAAAPDRLTSPHRHRSPPSPSPQRQQRGEGLQRLMNQQCRGGVRYSTIRNDSVDLR